MSQAGSAGGGGGGGGGTTSFDTDSGTATPLAGVINIFGTANEITTSGAGNTVTIAFTPSIIVTDDITLGGNLHIPTTNMAGSAGIVFFGASPWIQNYGTRNTFVGASAGNQTLTVGNATDNTGIGTGCLAGLTTGRFCTAVGSQAGQSNQGGESNTSMGYICGQNINSGSRNTNMGSFCGAAINSGTDNTAMGYNAASSINTGTNNTAMGSGALSGNVNAGSFNTSIGSQSLNNLDAGSYNISIGYNAGANSNGTDSSNIYIGNQGMLGESNVMRLGTDGNGNGEVDTTFIAGDVTTTGGLTVATGNLSVAGGTISATGNITSTGGALVSTTAQIVAATYVAAGSSVFVQGNEGFGIAGATAFTNATNTTQGVGLLTILSTNGNPGTNAGFLQIYVGTTVAYIPYYTNIAP